MLKGRELDTQHAGSMERVREQRPFCSLSKSQRDRETYFERDKDQERRYTASSAEREEGACRVPTQKSYSSSETLQAFDHDPSRMLFGVRVKEMVHKDSAEYSRPGERENTFTWETFTVGFCPFTDAFLKILSEICVW